MTDKEIEKLWYELEDVPFDEKDGTLLLSVDWNRFKKGTDRDSIWHWFDEHHSKGVGWLMSEYEREV